VPTLVIHASRDDVSPASASRELAAGIPGAEFVQLESRNHVLLEEEPAWARFRDLVLEFTGRLRARQRGEAECFTALTGREREVLGALIAGSSNAQIAAGLAISDKTVRNMLTRIFDKLGVKSRAQAIVLARDGRFDAGP
jgi:DNA-binding NarL/FixJ family response regulator